uniref:RING-type domain-containing protein n=1 Tax=Glossina brevipalpis TaxID=37001 RepID=A0A1A9WF43_9MUSC
MPATCSICAEYFNNLDNISSTSCGHVYHYKCICDWKARSNICPICRSSNLNIQKIFLNFDDGNSTEALNDNLRIKLDNVQKIVNEQKEELDKSEKKYIELQKEYNLSESNFLNLHKQYTESDEYVKTLKATVAEMQLNKIEHRISNVCPWRNEFSKGVKKDKSQDVSNESLLKSINEASSTGIMSHPVCTFANKNTVPVSATSSGSISSSSTGITSHPVCTFANKNTVPVSATSSGSISSSSTGITSHPVSIFANKNTDPVSAEENFIHF